MFLKNKDLEILIKVENYLGLSTNEKELTSDMIELINRLLKQKENYNKKNYARIKEKRKLNKNYAR